VRHYTLADGLTFGPLAFRDATGALWFGTYRELSRLVPAPPAAATPPSVWISGINVGGVARAVPELGTLDGGTIAVASGERHVSVEFFAIGEWLQYQYRLIGSDDRWSRPADLRTVHYASLSPGTYRFEVRAISAEGALSQPATVVFRIPPPFWQRWWFLVLVTVTGATTLYGAHRRSVARQVEVERVRTRIATDLHDDLGASLSRVAILSEVVKQRIGTSDVQSESLLTEIADSSRGLIGSMRDLVWVIDPGAGTLADLEARVRQVATALLEPRGIVWSLPGVDGADRLALSSDQRRQLLMFFKEGLNNAVRYADCGHVTLDIAVSPNVLACRIQDDGRGFDPATTLQGREGGGRGLRNLQARAAALGGSLEVHSVPGSGTTLTLMVPFS
jgi:signal transduction histidine kinase